MKHTFTQHDKHCPNPGRCMICDGGLANCEVCGCFEGSLPTDCPGIEVAGERQLEIYHGLIDFRDGEWVPACSPASPVSILRKEPL